MRHFLRCFALLFTAATAHAAAPLEGYLDGGTFLVASLDLDDATSEESTQWLIGTIEAAAPALGADDARMAAMIARQVIGQQRELRDLGVHEVNAFVAIDDLTMNHGPLVVAQLPDEAAAVKALNWVRPRLAMTPGFETRLAGSTLLVATTATLDRYEKLTPAARPDLVDPLDAEGAALTAVLSPGADARRVLRELWPMLPPPYNKLTGSLMADDLRGVTATMHLGAAPNAELSIHSPDPSAREAVAKAVTAGLQAGVAWVEANQPPFASGAKSAADLLAPQTDDAAVIVRLDATDPAVRQLATNVFAPAIVAARERAQRASKLNDMKQIGLAMLNFESANGFLPGNIVDKDGAPLHSWRVLILPYLDQQALFNELRLDEPWDSKHNLEVAVKAAPELYCHGNQVGNTAYLRPVTPADLVAGVTEKTLIEKNYGGRKVYLQPGVKYRDITDGTSNTLMVAEVAPAHAVFWTKPDDWEVDLNDPLAKLRTDKRAGFVTGYYDGSARYETFDIDPQLLKKLVTKSGGEVIER